MNKQMSFYIQRYFLAYMINQHNYGGNTIASYRDTFRILFVYLDTEGIDISRMKVDDVDQEKIIAFLDWLTSKRNNGVSTRNIRLAHLKSFYRFLMTNAPEYADLCSKILSIPFAKQTKNRLPAFQKKQ